MLNGELKTKRKTSYVYQHIRGNIVHSCEFVAYLFTK